MLWKIGVFNIEGKGKFVADAAIEYMYRIIMGAKIKSFLSVLANIKNLILCFLNISVLTKKIAKNKHKNNIIAISNMIPLF